MQRNGDRVANSPVRSCPHRSSFPLGRRELDRPEWTVGRPVPYPGIGGPIGACHVWVAVEVVPDGRPTPAIEVVQRVVGLRRAYMTF